MKLIRTDDGTLIKPEDGFKIKTTCVNTYGEIKTINWIWGWRWNKNEGRWGIQCIQNLFRGYEWINMDESELPTVKPIDVQ